MSVAGVVLGRVVEFEQGLPRRVVFPDIEHAGASGYLRELAVSDCSPATLRSYAYDLLRWFRFLHDRWTAWERAERSDVREFVELLREAQVPQRLNRRRDASPPGSVNPVTGKATPMRSVARLSRSPALTIRVYGMLASLRSPS